MTTTFEKTIEQKVTERLDKLEEAIRIRFSHRDSAIGCKIYKKM